MFPVIITATAWGFKLLTRRQQTEEKDSSHRVKEKNHTQPILRTALKETHSPGHFEIRNTKGKKKVTTENSLYCFLFLSHLFLTSLFLLFSVLLLSDPFFLSLSLTFFCSLSSCCWLAQCSVRASFAQMLHRRSSVRLNFDQCVAGNLRQDKVG